MLFLCLLVCVFAAQGNDFLENQSSSKAVSVLDTVAVLGFLKGDWGEGGCHVLFLQLLFAAFTLLSTTLTTHNSPP